MGYFILFLLIVFIVICATNIVVVPQSYIYLIETLGKYSGTWEAGLHIKIPFLQKYYKINIKEQVVDFQPQAVITKDNVAMLIDSVVYYKVMDPQLYKYGIENPIMGIDNLTATTLRNIIGTMTFDESLSGRDKINGELQRELDEATDKWGIKIARVEVKSIQPPKDLLDVMQKQKRADAEKKQAILEAEGHKLSVIERAEGDKQAKILAAEAERDAEIAIAEGHAKAVKLMYAAQADGLSMITDDTSKAALQLEYYKALKDVANGNSTKIFIPTNLTDLAGNIGVIGELMNDKNINKKVSAKQYTSVDPCMKEDYSYISKDAKSTMDAIDTSNVNLRGN